MEVFRTIYNIAKADLLERIRRFSFLVILGIMIMVAYFFVPPADGGYVTLYLDYYRGIYNSAWVGASVAISTTLFLSLFGFYLVKNSIKRDEQSGFGQIIAATPVSKLKYLIGKTISNFAVLSIIVFVVILMAIIMQLVREEVMKIELWDLISPFLFLTFPTLAVVSALSVLFETCKPLKGALGNVIYFIIFIVYVTCSSYIPYGTDIITDRMVNDLTALEPNFSGSYGIGILTLGEKPIQLFEWQGIQWTESLIGQQLILFLYAFLLVLVAAVIFRRFQEVPYAVDNDQEESATPLDEAIQGMNLGNKISDSEVRAATLTPVTVRESFLPLVFAEWRLMMKGIAPGWYIVAMILIILGLSMPLDISAQWMIWPITWIWPLVFWSGMGNREYRYQTYFLVASSPRFVFRQLTAVWFSGLLLTCITGIGMLIRFILEGDAPHVAYWISAALLIPSFGLATGVLTKTNRTFEILYMIIWYIGPINKMPYLDFMVTTSTEGTNWVTDIGINPWILSFTYILISIILLISAYISRSSLSRTT
ncbi:ABC transporter permease [Paenibacillus sp. M1]|uniref:ABC transporter permease n=1 Tax=Paenibacillus haidiansis TaxID=1574488 RepID=A0ABU7VMJ8_9BACL